MGVWSSALSFVGCWIGIPIGLVLGYLLFIYHDSTQVKNPVIRSMSQLDSNDLHNLLSEIPLWVKDPDFDRVDWINKFLQEMWPFLDKAVCKIIRETTKSYVEQYSGKYKIQSVEFEVLSLGTLPPVLQGIKLYDTQEDEIIVEPCLKWAGNPNIVIKARAFGMTATAQIVDVQLFVKPRVTLKPLVPTFPCFSKISVSLMEKPYIDFGLKLGGGDLMAIPCLYQWVQDLIKEQVAQLYLWPNSFDVPILDDARATQKPVGILHVKVIKGTNLKKMDVIGKSDPYVKMKLTGDRLQSRKTTVKMNTLDPEWNESFTLSIKDPESQVLELHAYDWDKVGAHDKMGVQLIPLKYLTPREPKIFTVDLQKSLDPNISQKRKPRGRLTVELTYSPFRQGDTFSSLYGDPDAENRSFKNTTDGPGVLVVTVHKAEDLEGKHHLNPYVKVAVMGDERKTNAIKKNRDPRWEQDFEYMLNNLPVNEKLNVQVFSKRMGFSLHGKEQLGFVEINLADVVYNTRINEIYNLIDSKNGKIHIEMEWRT